MLVKSNRLALIRLRFLICFATQGYFGMRLQTLKQYIFSLAIACVVCGPVVYGQGGGGDGGGGGGGGTATGGAGQAGVDIDAAGVLRVSHVDPSIAAAERLATLQSKPRGSVTTSKLRKVSLNRLEKLVSEKLEQGEALSDEVLSLAGLGRIEYVFYLPDSQDIVIAGPADQWHLDANNRLVGLTTGRATLRLEDLVVALRAFAPNGGTTSMIGCSIDPTQEGLKRMSQYHSQFGGTLPIGIDPRQIAMGMKESLGMQTISIRGVPTNTHFAQVLVEADYRMKLIGIGLEDPIIPLTSWIARSTGGAGASDLQRWYFQADYSAVSTNEAGTAMRLQGRGVMLTGEKEKVQKDGKRKRSGTAGDAASNGFTREFTEKFEALADAIPVFFEMRNLFDISIAAAFIQDRNLYQKSGWDLGVFGDESKFSVNTAVGVNQVETAVNVVWKDSQLITPIGGGVHIAARKLIDPSSTKVDKEIEAQRGKIAAPADLAENQWWWD
jgi:hypothetical protein